MVGLVLGGTLGFVGLLCGVMLVVSLAVGGSGPSPTLTTTSPTLGPSDAPQPAPSGAARVKKPGSSI
jgi:hypothetical protein